MSIGARSFGIESKADHGWLYQPEHFQDRQHIPFLLRLGCENIAGIEPKAEVFNILDLYTVMGPDKLFLKFTKHSLELLNVGRILLPAVAGSEELDVLFKLIY